MELSAKPISCFVPHKEQTDSQRGRRCSEYVVTLRLLMDLAREEKFICDIVDFVMIYDRVPRTVLVTILGGSRVVQ